METKTYTAFAGTSRISSGDVSTMLLGAKRCLDAGEDRPILIFEDQTGIQIDFNLRGTSDEVLSNLAVHPHFSPPSPLPDRKPGPGRPNLGVVSREVSLLPRHWEWLGQQPSGASAAIRRLVDEARKRSAGKDRARQARDAAAKFMWTMAGNQPGFEEASRALYARDRGRFDALTAAWPEDIREYLGQRVHEAERLERGEQG